jgi:hypothetical protein
MLIPLGILASSIAGFRAGVAGYFSGGADNSGNGVTIVDKYTFPAETRSTLGTGLSSGRWASSSFANSGVAGYNAGGSTSNTGDGSTNVTTVDKFALPSDSRSTLGTGISGLYRHNVGMANSGVAGYSGGGIVRPSNANISTVDKFDFPSDTRSSLGSGLSTARRELGAVGNTTVAGYFAGGYSSDFVSTVDKYSFPSDSRSTLATGLSTTRRDLAGASNQGIAGYFAGGNNGSGFTATIDKFAFPSDTRSTLGTGLSSSRSFHGGIVDGQIAGYFGGGYNGSANVTTVDKIEFSSDSRTTLASGLSAIRVYPSGFSNEGVF